MTNPSEAYAKREPITEEELASMLRETEGIKNEYYRLRVRALIGLLKKFGKRRREISTLQMNDLEVSGEWLNVTFLICKKHKKGLFQFLKELKKQGDPELADKSYAQLLEEWQQWQKTEQGHRQREDKRTKQAHTQDRYVKLILEYVEYMKRNYPDAKYLFPSGRCFFGSAYIVNPHEPLSGSQLLRLVKPLNPRIWLHLFRELRGKEISEDMGATVSSVTEVMNYLDLEKEETAWHYVRRFARQKAKIEF